MRLIPRNVAEEAWVPFVQQRDYAVLCGPNDTVYLRFGQGHGMYLSMDPTPSGRMVNGVDFETGAPSLLGKLPSGAKVILGRTSDCAIKVMHAIVSRHHLELTHIGNILILRDLGSTNGTYVQNEIKHFDIESYIEKHPIDKASESTLDWAHEAFGPTLDDFLKTYSQSKKEKN